LVPFDEGDGYVKGDGSPNDEVQPKRNVWGILADGFEGGRTGDKY
jgi:hypothetical protein